MTTRLPMQLAAANLERIANALTDAELNDALAETFAESRLDLAASIDRRIMFMDLAQDRIQTLKRLKMEFSEAAKRMETALERVKDNTLATMEMYPDLPYRGELGKLKAQNNSSPRTVVELFTQNYQVSNVVDANDIHKHKIDERFFETKSYYCLVIDEIKKALESGEKIEWARLERGKHVRVYR